MIRQTSPRARARGSRHGGFDRTSVYPYGGCHKTFEGASSRRTHPVLTAAATGYFSLHASTPALWAFLSAHRCAARPLRLRQPPRGIFHCMPPRPPFGRFCPRIAAPPAPCAYGSRVTSVPSSTRSNSAAMSASASATQPRVQSLSAPPP